MYYHATVPFGDAFFLMGGHISSSKDVNAIYEYEPKTGHWTLMPYRLSSPAHGFTAFSVDRETLLPSN